MKSWIAIAAAIFCFVACKKEVDPVLFQINNQFALYETAACNCITLQKQVSETENVELAKNVVAILGNPQEFMLQTSPSGAPMTQWSFVQTMEVITKEDIRLLQQSEIDSILDKLAIDFMKDYNDR